MMLVDTSVWVDHFRRGDARLVHRLDMGLVASHDFVIGELACGNLQRRSQILGYLSNLPRTPAARHEEVLELVERRRLSGVGLGWRDAHLLAAALMEGVKLWTSDKPLLAAARRLSVAAESRDFL